MSNNRNPPSKFLSSFYAGPGQNAGQIPAPGPSTRPPGSNAKPPLPSKQWPVAQGQGPHTPTKSTNDADKFKKPADFFKSSQSVSSQNLSSQSRLLPVKRTSFGSGGSTHEMLSQSFQPKKPTMSNSRPPPSNLALTPQSANLKPQSSQSANLKPQSSQSANLKPPSSQMAPPCFGFPTKQFPVHRKPTLDKNVASTKALELQWTTKMRQKSQVGGVDKRNLTDAKSPMGKSFWADSSFSKTDAACKNQQNDPWYSNDVWGDDLSVEAVDECLRFATQAQKSAEMVVLDDPLSSWMDESWASPEKFPSPPKSGPSARTALFTEDKPKDDFMALLAGDDEFLALVDDVESSAKIDKPSPSSLRSASSGTKMMASNSFPPSQARKPVPFSERMPVTGNKSFVVKAKEYESPNKQDLTLSQRTLRKPTKSLPSPTTTKIGFTTEWLRGQLEKISSKYSTVKEDLEVKEGESKLLREKLKSAEEEVQKHKIEKVKELESLRDGFEKKVKALEKQLEATQVQAMFKAKEAESSLEKYRELKSVSVRTPEAPPVNHNFKNFTSGARPGESRVLIEETICTSDIIDKTLDFVTPIKIEPPVEGTPEKNHSPILEVEVETEGEVEKRQSPAVDLIFDQGLLRRNEVFAQVAQQLVHGEKPKKELNHFLMPPMEYLPHTLLQTEFSEQQVENYPVRRPTLVELWGTSYNMFGEAALDDYEKAAVGDVLPPDHAQSVLAKSRYFTTTESMHSVLLSLSNKTKWSSSERLMAKSVVDLATKMVRELYATLGDPRLLQTTYTIYDRDPKIVSEFQDCSELVDQFDPLSPKKWKNESYVELRRCLVIVGFLCSVDHVTARYIINPKSLNDRGVFYPPGTESSQNLSRRSKDDNVALKIVLKEGERKPNELKLMQMYRDLHSKKLTLVCKLSSSLDPTSSASKASLMEVDGTDVTEQGVASLSKVKATRSEVFRHSELLMDLNGMKFDEFERCVGDLGLALRVDDVAKLVDFNPCKVMQIKNHVEQVLSSNSSKAIVMKKDWVNISQSLLVDSVVQSNGAVFNTPVDKCISNLEKLMMDMTFRNTLTLHTRVRTRLEKNTPTDLDLTRYVPVSPDADWEKTRKRKISQDGAEPSKIMKVDEYETPPFDTNLLSQIQRKNPEEDPIFILDTQTQPLPEDDQLAKFERREEMAELKKKMLADEKILESKPSTSRHSLAPLRLPGRTSPTCEDSADKEMVMEIEKMFQTQVKPVDLEESVWCSESDDEVEAHQTQTASREDKVEIEFIPDLVKHFHHKLQHAGLLELLCEVFKEGGILRFTHKLSGVLLGTVTMLQKIVMYQKKEVEAYCGKLATIIREILYMRPSPRIVLEVNVLLRHAAGINGFTKMLCHNASPDTFVISADQVHFTRGACLLEVICILVTYSTEDATDHTVYFELVHWIHRIMVCDKKHMATLYEQHNSERRRCMCITALNNTLVMVFHRSLSLYRRHCEIHSLTQPNGQLQEKLFAHSLQVLRLVHSYGSLSFLYSIKTQILEYRQLLTWLREMHRDAIVYGNFRLSQSDSFVVDELLKYARNPNSVPERPSEWACRPNFNHLRRNSQFDSLIKSDSSESEEE